MTSLRKRMLVWQGAAILAAAVVAALVSYDIAWRGFNKVRDHSLEQVAYAIVRHGLDSEGGDVANAEHPMADVDSTERDRGQFMSQIWRAGGELQYASSSLVGPPPQHDGFEDVMWHGQEWRVFSVSASNKRVQVAVPTERREASFDEWLPIMLGLATLVFLLLGVMSHIGVKLAFRPMQRLQDELALRNPQSLSPMDTAGLPDEIKTLGVSFNQLLGRLDAVLQEQRQFLSDAAHGLNTPLAALKLRAQLLPLMPQQDLPQAYHELNQAIERTVHLVAQLLRLVRISPSLPDAQAEWVDLGRLVQDVISAMEPVLHSTGHEVVWAAPEQPVGLSGDPYGLRALVENLLSNVLHYTPPGTHVNLALGADEQITWLEVIDHGPGIPDDRKPRALERFARLTPGDGKGSGLGLAISRAVAQQHGGELWLLDTAGGGLTVRVVFPHTQT